MRRIPVLLLLLGCTVAAPKQDLHTVEGALDFGGRIRTYDLHIPPGLDAQKP